MLINLRNALMTSGKKPAYWGLCFTAEEAGSTIALIKVSSAPAVTLQTSTDGKSWTPYTIGDVITLGAIGDSIFFAAGEDGNTRLGSSIIRYHQFSMTGKIAAAGNIMSLLSADEPQPQITGTYTFYRLFSGCTSLTTAPELPATTLAASCYQQMFSGCTSLTTAPELPATTLAAWCYNSMFSGCTSLTAAPELTDGIAYAYHAACESMFENCTSLTAARVLVGNRAATTSSSAFRRMFMGCENLKSLEVPNFTLFGGTSGEPITRDWLLNVASQGVFKCPERLGTDETIQRGASYCPDGWTVVNI